MPSEPTVIVSSRVPHDILEALDAAAARHGRTRTKQVLAWIEAGIQREAPGVFPEDARKAKSAPPPPVEAKPPRREVQRDGTIIEYDE